VCFVVRKTISEYERVVLTTLFLPVQKILTVGVPGRDLQCAFPLDVSMIPSSSIAIDGECLTCSGFFLDEIIHLGNFKFIVDYFASLSLSSGGGVTQAPLSWAQLIAEHEPHDGP
jgi:hypothetical protein